MVAGNCTQDSTTFNAGYGPCPSYAAGQINHVYCHMDGAALACPVACHEFTAAGGTGTLSSAEDALLPSITTHPRMLAAGTYGPVSLVRSDGSAAAAVRFTVSVTPPNNSISNITVFPQAFTPAPPPVLCTFDDMIACDFESSSLCSWAIVSPGSGANPTWLRGSYTPSTITGPTIGYSGSNFMFLETSTPSRTGDVSYLVSPTFITGMTRLSFYYHMYGADMGTLSVEVLVFGVWTELWHRTGQQHLSQSSSWLPASVTMPSGTTQMRFKGLAGPSYNGDMAVDTVTISAGAQGCNWTTPGVHNSWTRGTLTPSLDTGPNFGHSGSNFMFLETSHIQPGVVGYLVSPTFSDMVSVEFYYHMYGVEMGELAVETLSSFDNSWTQQWNISGQQHSSHASNWTRASVAISRNVVQLRFKGVKGSGFQSDMAVDSVIISGIPPLVVGEVLTVMGAVLTLCDTSPWP